MTPRPSVSAEDLDRWADRHEAAAVLPELVRRLLLATAAVRELEMRAGKGVYLEGFDGVVVAREGTAFCPEGPSVWELSTRADVRKKLDGDYRKRAKEPGVEVPRSVVLVLVTARRFPDKARWMERSNADRRWRRVRVLDADDLATWLEQAPLVAAWFSHVHLERPAYELWDPESYLRRWSRQTEPALPPSLVLEGRETERRRFEEWLEQVEAGHGVQVLRIVATTRDEARIFALAVLDGLIPDPRRKVWIARCTVVESAEAWRWAVKHAGPERWLLIPAFVDDAMVTGTTDRSAYAVLPLDGSAPNRDGIELRDPMPWKVVEETLRSLSVDPGKAERIARETRGDLPALRIALDLDGRPAWVEVVDRTALVAMMLVGAWSPANEMDALAVQRLGVEPENLDQICGILARERDAPIEKVDAAWAWKSHATAWSLLHESLTPSRRQVFAEVAIDVLTGRMPPNDPGAPRQEASSHGLGFRRAYTSCSAAMEAGISASLGHLSQRVDEGRSGADVAARVIREVLGPTWQRWMRLTEVLSDLAEAAPRAFLDALEEGLTADDEGFSQWMSDEKASSAWRLLHTLQMLAWDRKLAPKASFLLIELAILVDANHSAQRMLSSLYAIYNLYYPQTRLSDEERFRVLRKVVDRGQHRGWQLLVELVDGLANGVVQPSPTPRLMPLEGIPTEPPPTTIADLTRRIDSLMDIVIEEVKADPERWRELLTKRLHRHLPNEAWQAVLVALRARRHELPDPDGRIWETLRTALSDMLALHGHRERAEAEGLEHSRSRLHDLESLYHAFEPEDPVVRCAWLFYNRNTLPEPGIKQDWYSIEPILEQRRQSSVRELVSAPEGPESIARLIVLFSNDTKSVALENLARAIAQSDSQQDFERSHLREDPGPRSRALAPHLARQVYLARGQDLAWLEDLLLHWLNQGRLDDAHGAIAEMHAPGTWDLLDRLGDPLRTKYWQSVAVVPGNDADDWERVVASLLAAGNVPAAIQTASYRAKHLSTTTIIKALQAARQVVRSKDVVDVARFDHDIEDLFSHLDERSDSGMSLEELAELELELLHWLDSHFSKRGLRYIPARLEASVPYFVSLVCRAYAPEDSNEAPDVGEAKRARLALHMWKSYPGSSLSDPDACERMLFDWASEALRQTVEMQRSRAGQAEVAAVLARPEQAEDGHWPSLAARRLLESGRYRKLGLDLRTFKERPQAAWGVADGGRDEHERADRYEASATALRARWPTTASMLDDLAERHRREAIRRDEDARRERLAHGRPAPAVSAAHVTQTQESSMKSDHSDDNAPPSAISKLELVDVGPSAHLPVDLAPRLNLITGDNGVGKTFLLDVLWWCLTGTWPQPGHPAWPSYEAREREPTIRVTDANGETSSSVFDRTNDTWPRPTGWPPCLAPVLYVRLDGRFSLWDPRRNRGQDAPTAYHFDSLWGPLEDAAGNTLCEGLIHDWRDWSRQDDKSLFEKFFGVVKTLMPLDEGRTPQSGPEPAKEFVKLSTRNVTKIPQLRLRSGDVPIEHLSAGMKRILGVAYLLIWSWNEHVEAAKLLGTTPASQIVLLIDEAEAHLHPKWQRMLLPALLESAEGLAQERLSVQIVATTHSPLVVASLEPHFDPDTDQLLHLGYEGNKIRIKEIPWANHGDASAWLESPVFELDRSTNPELERVLNAAHDLLANVPQSELPDGLDTREKLDRELRRLLPSMDPFWLLWGAPLDEVSQ